MKFFGQNLQIQRVRSKKVRVSEMYREMLIKRVNSILMCLNPKERFNVEELSNEELEDFLVTFLDLP